MPRLVLGETIPVKEFEFTQVIAAQAKPGILRVTINDDIYQNVVHPDLRDVVILDTNGNPAPYIVQGNERTGKTTQLTPVPFFALMGDDKVGLDEFKVHITRNKKGDVKSVNTSREGYQSDDVVGYLLDLNQVTRPVDRIILKFQNNGKDKLRGITVSGSVNLKAWQLIHDEVLIGRIEHNDQVLIIDSVGLGGKKFRQIHISWEDLVSPLVLTDVSLLTGSGSSATRQWKTVPAVEDGKAHVYDTKGLYPVDRVQPGNLPDGAAIVYSLYSKASLNDAWRLIGEYDYYKKKIENKKLESLPGIVPLSRDRYWKMEIDSEIAGGRQINPVLDFGWVADQILLKAEAGKYYTIAYGHAGITSKEMDTKEFLLQNGEQEVRTIVPGMREEVAGAGSSEIAPVSKQHGFFNEWLKWLLLLAGVLILLLLAAKFLTRPGQAE
jgi:hypothetical protein